MENHLALIKIPAWAAMFVVRVERENAFGIDAVSTDLSCCYTIDHQFVWMKNTATVIWAAIDSLQLKVDMSPIDEQFMRRMERKITQDRVAHKKKLRQETAEFEAQATW